MKRKLVLFILIGLLAGCQSQGGGTGLAQEPSLSSQPPSSVLDIPLNETLFGPPPYYAALKEAGVIAAAEENGVYFPEENEYQTVEVMDTATGTLTAKEPGQTVTLLGWYLSGGDFYHQPILAVETETDTVFEVVTEGCYGTQLWLRDVDGDGLDEIITHSMVGATGGAGSYVVRILKWDGHSFSEWWNGDTPEMEGFTLSLEPDFVHTVHHEVAGMQYTFRDEDLAELFSHYNADGTRIDPKDESIPSSVDHHPFYRPDGTLTEEGATAPWIATDSAYDVQPVDVDGDGAYELIMQQYSHIWGHSNGIGVACSLWGLDEDGAFRVLKAGFQPYCMDFSQGPFADWEEFNQYWYRPDELPAQ